MEIRSFRPFSAIPTTFIRDVFYRLLSININLYLSMVYFLGHGTL